MDKVSKFIKAIDELGCDCALVSDRSNVRYLSGFTGSAGYLIISKDRRLLVTDFRYVEQASEQAREFEIINSKDFKFGEYMANFENVAFEDRSISYKGYLRYEKVCKKLTPMEGTITKIRRFKTADEIDCIRRAASIASDAFFHIIKYIRIGMTEREIARELEHYMVTHGADKISFDTIVATGARGSLPHATPGDNVVRDGDLIVMDYGCKVDGYCSDMTRTVGIGNVDEESKKAYNTVLKAQLECLDMIKPGVICSSVHKHSFDVIDSAYPGLYGHSLGHGVGLEVHEEPGFTSGYDIPAEPGYVLTVEPGVYIPGKCGVRIEDLIVITEDGFENLCTPPKELIII